jgi:hypothetical protein
MCLDCGAVRTDIPPGSDTCAVCKSGIPSTSAGDTKELIEFVAELGFERPVILAAIMKLQLDNAVINTESVVSAIGELLAPIENDTSGTNRTSPPPSNVAYVPTHTPQPTFPPPSKLTTPSAPPLHTQDSPASDNDRAKCKVMLVKLFLSSSSPPLLSPQVNNFLQTCRYVTRTI